MNDLIENRSWFSKNWIWFIPFLMIFLIGIYAISSTKVGEGIVTFSKAYNEKALYDDALEKVKLNSEVKELIGELECLDSFAILEGTTIFSNNGNSVKTSVRIVGSKSKGKLPELGSLKSERSTNKLTIKLR